MTDEPYGSTPPQLVTFDEVRRVKLNPGDTVVLRSTRPLSAEEHDELQASWHHTYSGAVYLLVLDGGLLLEGVASGLEPK